MGTLAISLALVRPRSPCGSWESGDYCERDREGKERKKERERKKEKLTVKWMSRKIWLAAIKTSLLNK